MSEVHQKQKKKGNGGKESKHVSVGEKKPLKTQFLEISIIIKMSTEE